MPVQVSYKKQFALFLCLFLILLIVIEVFANIWLYYFYRCDFEDNELFLQEDPEINRKICIESLAYGITDEQVHWEEGTRSRSGLDESLVFISSQRFRSPEFSEIKPENTFRIFTIGGSTTFGAGVLDNQTYPYYLQELFDSSDVNFKVEVINTGWAKHWSLTETELIKNRILSFDPDLFIVYDGWNEINEQIIRNDERASPQLWKERWIEICELGKNDGFQTIVTLQPLASTGEKILTEQEYLFTTKSRNKRLVDPYPQYAEQLAEMEKHCTITKDLRNLFDNIPEPIYYDLGHTGPRGNQIIAEKMFQISLPLVIKGYENKDLNDNYQVTDDINNQMVSKNFYPSSEEFSRTLKSIIVLYKTPKVIPLIFQ